jgi:hypothetical protein
MATSTLTALVSNAIDKTPLADDAVRRGKSGIVYAEGRIAKGWKTTGKPRLLAAGVLPPRLRAIAVQVVRS